MRWTMPTILENVLIEEYDRSRRMAICYEEEIASLPKGYIREKIIKGHTYYYLQYREGTRVRSKYIPKSELDDLRDKLKRREEYVEARKARLKEMRQIERALGKRFINEHTD